MFFHRNAGLFTRLQRWPTSARLFVLASTAALTCCSTASITSANSWDKQSTLTYPGATFQGPQLALGPKGMTAVSWSPASRPTLRANAGRGKTAPARLTVRFRPNSEASFSKPRRFGQRGSSGGALISARGETFVYWAERNGTLKSVSRLPSGKWTKIQVIAPRSNGAVAHMANDGTVVVASAVRSRHSAKKAVFASVRPPGHRRFGPWRSVSRNDGQVGLDLAVAARGKGRAGVAWSGSCSTKARNVRVVQVTSRRLSPWGTIGNTKCPTTGIDLVDDGNGALHLLVSGSPRSWQGIFGSSKRPGGWFTRGRLLSRRGVTASHGSLKSNRRGQVLAIWKQQGSGLGGDSSSSAYMFSANRGPTGFTLPRKIDGVSPKHLLLDHTSFLRGSAILLWQNLDTWAVEASSLYPEGSASTPLQIGGPLRPDSLAYGAVASGGGDVAAIWATRSKMLPGALENLTIRHRFGGTRSRG